MPHVAFFGGSFNPPHVAHVLAVSYALSVGEFDRVLMVPVFQHAFSKPLVDYRQRLAMSRLAVAPLRGVEVSDVESKLPVPSYTLDTIRHLRERHPDWSLSLMIGSDQLGERQDWRGFDEIVELAPLFELPRAGYLGEHRALLPELSSSEVRELLARRSELHARQRLATLIPSRVLAYIEEHRLYCP